MEQLGGIVSEATDVEDQTVENLAIVTVLFTNASEFAEEIVTTNVSILLTYSCIVFDCVNLHE